MKSKAKVDKTPPALSQQGRPAAAVKRGSLQKIWNKNSAIIGLIMLSATLIGLVATIVFGIEPHLKADQAAVIKIQLEDQLKEPLKQLNDEDRQLTSIKTSLDEIRPYIQDIVRHDFESVLKLSSPEFARRLPALKDLLAVARSQGVGTSTSTSSGLAMKLRQIPNTSIDYWPTAAELISYRSAQNPLTGGAQSLPSGMPNCTDSNPQPARVTGVVLGVPHGLSLPFYEACKFTIDSKNDDDRVSSWLTNNSPTLLFVRCLIIYRGGDFQLPVHTVVHDAEVQTNGKGRGLRVDYDGPALQFNDCVYDVSVPNEVSRPAQRILTAMLDASAPYLRLPVDGEARHSKVRN